MEHGTKICVKMHSFGTGTDIQFYISGCHEITFECLVLKVGLMFYIGFSCWTQGLLGFLHNFWQFDKKILQTIQVREHL